MKIPSLLILVVATALAGCESLSDATGVVRERLANREEVKTRAFSAPPRVVYEAVRTAAAQMGYRAVRGGPAQGEFDALSGVKAGETHGSARQITMKVRLRATLDGTGTDVAVSLAEIIEQDSSNRAGQATGMALRDTPQYEVFFERVGQVLGAPKT